MDLQQIVTQKHNQMLFNTFNEINSNRTINLSSRILSLNLPIWESVF